MLKGTLKVNCKFFFYYSVDCFRRKLAGHLCGDKSVVLSHSVYANIMF